MANQSSKVKATKQFSKVICFQSECVINIIMKSMYTDRSKQRRYLYIIFLAFVIFSTFHGLMVLHRYAVLHMKKIYEPRVYFPA